MCDHLDRIKRNFATLEKLKKVWPFSLLVLGKILNLLWQILSKKSSRLVTRTANGLPRSKTSLIETSRADTSPLSSVNVSHLHSLQQHQQQQWCSLECSIKWRDSVTAWRRRIIEQTMHDRRWWRTVWPDVRVKSCQTFPIVAQKSTTADFTQKSSATQKSPKIHKYLSHFCMKICYKELSKIAQSGHNDDGRKQNFYKFLIWADCEKKFLGWCAKPKKSWISLIWHH